MKHNKQIRLVRQDGNTSLRIVLVDNDGEIVHVGEEPLQFTAPDIDRLLALYQDAVLCFNLPIITVPAKKKSGTSSALLSWDWDGYPENDD